MFHPDGVATNSEAIKGAKVEVWDSEFPFPDQKLASGTTNEQGEFEFEDLNNDDGFLQGGMDVYVKVYAKNDAVEVHTNPWWLFGGVYEHKTSTKNDVASGDVNFGTVYTPLDDHGAWRIQNQLPIAKEFLRVQTGLNIRQTKAFYRDLFSPASSYYFGGALPHLDIFGFLPPGASLSDLRGIHYSDTNFHDGITTWRTNEVIYHEYGHFVLDEYADSWPPTTEMLHEFRVAYNTEHAWVEGFVEFFSAAVREWDGEPYDSYGLAPPIEQNHNGDSVEGSIAGVLWDLYDDHVDAGDSADMEFSEIWDVVVEYDPDTIFGWPVGADHPWNIYDYWDGFSTRRFGDVNVGYLWQILQAHSIDIDDTTPPMNPVEAITPHTPGESSTNNFIYIFWDGATDTESGVFSYKWALTEDSDRDLLGNLGYRYYESYDLLTTSTSLRAELYPEHTYWFHLITKDRAGNWASETYHLGPFTILPKVVGPVTSILEDAEILVDYEGKIYLNHETFIDLQIYDPHQKTPDKSYYKLFNSQFDSGVKQYSQSFKLEDLTDGQYTMNFWTTSIDAQFNEPTNTKIIILDSTPPTTSHTIGSPQSSDGVNTIVTPITPITLDAVDDGSGVESTNYRLITSSFLSDWTRYVAPISPSSALKLEKGMYTLEYYSSDNVGNNETVKNVDFFLEYELYSTQSIVNPRLTGKVYDTLGDPVASVKVELFDTQNLPLTYAMTDNNGVYSIFYNPGIYIVKTSPPDGNVGGTDSVKVELSEGTVVQDLFQIRDLRMRKVAFSSDRDGDPEIYTLYEDGSGLRKLTNNIFSDELPNWSPDGSKIVFQSNRDGNMEIYIMNADGSEQTRLTYNNADDLDGCWSPDGSKIAFTSIRDANYEIYTMNADGSEQTRLTNNRYIEGETSWSPEGSKIAFASNRDGNYEIYTINPDGSEPIRITNNYASDGDPNWSPDGSKIVFNTDRHKNYEVYVMNSDGTEQKRLTYLNSVDGQPSWSPDGTKIAFLTDRDSNYEVYIMNSDGSEQRNLSNESSSDYGSSWQNLYLTNFQQIGVGSDFTDTILKVDDIIYNTQRLPASQSITPITSHSYTWISPLLVSNEKRYVWTSTSGLSEEKSGKFLATSGNDSLVGLYDVQYYINFQSSSIGELNKLSEWYSESSEVSISAIPSEGYKFTNWITNGDISILDENSQESILVINGPGTVEAQYILDTFIISTSTTTGGEISPSGNIDVLYGDDQNFKITPNEGYSIDDILVDGSSEGELESYSFTNVMENHTIAVDFQPLETSGIPGYPFWSIVVGIMLFSLLYSTRTIIKRHYLSIFPPTY